MSLPNSLTVLLMLLLLLSRFSCVRLCATHRWQPTSLPRPWDSPGKNTSGLPFPSPFHESEKWKWSCSVVSTLSDPPGSSVHGIFQARVLEWGAIAFSIVLRAAFWCPWILLQEIPEISINTNSFKNSQVAENMDLESVCVCICNLLTTWPLQWWSPSRHHIFF